jgi:hypothetical protein
MNGNELISNIHWIAVVVLTVLSFLIGFIWHRPFLFGKSWKKENNPDDKPVKINVPLVFGGTAVLHFLALAGLSAVVSGRGAITGLTAGLGVSIVWILPAMGGTYLFASRSIKLLSIDTGMYIFMFTISGAILGLW